MALFEQTSSARSGSRFGKLSSNMFFTRNTAKPKRVRHIEGLNGALICNVNDEPSVVRSSSASSIGMNKPNLSAYETPRRTERLLPPMGFWNTFGVIRDTDHWRQELASLASASGLGIDKDEPRFLHRPVTNTDPQHASRSGARYSTRTGRFNEGTPKSRGRTGSKHGTAYSDMLFNMPENEREMWMLQVLCQLLGTSNLEDVQSWLVSASLSEKEHARTMITSALQGFKESERTNDQNEQAVDLDLLSNFVDKQKHDEKQASHKFIQGSLNRPASIDSDQKGDSHLRSSWSNLVNNNYTEIPLQNASTYQSSYQNYNRRSLPSSDMASSMDKLEQNPSEDDNQNTTETNGDHPLAKVKRQLSKPATPLERSLSSHQQRHRMESFQFHDNQSDNGLENNRKFNLNGHPNEEQQQSVIPSYKEIILPPIKLKDPSEQDDNAKSRTIRQLKNRLSRQEDESKKQLSDLQSKQSRLENALKLLAKQNSASSKPRQTTTHDGTAIANLDAPAVNMKTGPENDNEPRRYYNNNSADNRSVMPNSGVWKPEPSILQRLQGN